jgi:exopolysaccharide biosynthesis polyprenyl glycosylphosphotransferase
MRRYALQVAVGDFIAVCLAAALATFLRFGVVEHKLIVFDSAVPYWLVAAITVPVWLAVLAACRGYEHCDLGNGPDELRRVVRAGVYFLAGVGVAAFAFDANLARGFVAGMLPLAIAMTMLGRLINRRWLRSRRRRGRCTREVLVAGTPEHVRAVTRHFLRNPWSGYRVVGACVPEGLAGVAGAAISVGTTQVPVVGPPDEVIEALAKSGADVLAVTDAEELGTSDLRLLGWELEGTGVDLVVAPAITDVAGPRIAIRPVSGLPLLHVEEPKLSGFGSVAKAIVDRLAAAAALVFLAPVFLVVAVIIKVTTAGPVFFKQERVGKLGKPFMMVKFRTMVVGAEAMLPEIVELNENDGLLFKMRNDPRVTPIGRWLRRWSLDELPQLFNVLKGQMSFVGPRPPLIAEAERYGDDVRRRLLVKPGLTGLWQVSGRSDLPWEEAVRLDLYYVDNWSPTLDLAILFRTLRATFAGHGAY